MPRLLVEFVADDAVDLESKTQTISALQSQHIRSKFEISYETTLQLLQTQKAIERSLREAARHVDSKTDAGKKIFESLAQAQKGVAETSALAESLYNTVPGIARPATDASAAKAQEVFSTPELLENILAVSHPVDILTAMQAQHCWRDTVLGSVKLKRKLGLESFEDDYYYSPFSMRYYPSPLNDPRWGPKRALRTGPGIYHDDIIMSPHEDARDPEEVENLLSIWMLVYDNEMRRLGPRIRDMLISNIPVTSLTVRQDCGLCRKTGQKKYQVKRPTFSIRSSSTRGFILGELADLLDAAKHSDGHRRCLDITYNCTATLTLDEDDPIMIKRRQDVATRMRHDLAREELLRPENRCLHVESDESEEEDALNHDPHEELENEVFQEESEFAAERDGLSDPLSEDFDPLAGDYEDAYDREESKDSEDNEQYEEQDSSAAEEEEEEEDDGDGDGLRTSL